MALAELKKVGELVDGKAPGDAAGFKEWLREVSSRVAHASKEGGFFGIGGGFLIVPGLMAATGMTLANAAASSLVSVVLFGGATSLSYAASGLVDWKVFLALVVGGVIGAVLGAPVSRLLAGRADLARRVFAVMVVVTAAYVAWQAVRG